MYMKGDSDKLVCENTLQLTYKYSFGDSIPEVDNFPNVQGKVHHSFPIDISVFIIDKKNWNYYILKALENQNLHRINIVDS